MILCPTHHVQKKKKKIKSQKDYTINNTQTNKQTNTFFFNIKA